jgi:hypothetical protein
MTIAFDPVLYVVVRDCSIGLAKQGSFSALDFAHDRLYNRSQLGGWERMQASQKRATANHRRRLRERGISRYEVRGLEQDKALIRGLANRLAANDAEAVRLRREVSRQVSAEVPQRGGIWEALRRSPAVGADLDLARPIVGERDVDL